MAIRLDENSKSSSNSTRHACSPSLENFQLPLIFLNGPETSVMEISLNGVATFRVVNDLRMPFSENSSVAVYPSSCTLSTRPFLQFLMKFG